jgi:hypothetical protein
MFCVWRMLHADPPLPGVVDDAVFGLMLPEEQRHCLYQVSCRNRSWFFWTMSRSVASATSGPSVLSLQRAL